ncbi:uncharacterized protein LOC128245752 [Mya arenaria]|uniref:uncharacterized protein LOC128245752 n=1 Tax=Mya arenaria TaxID=6604 RepID=UPI0022DEC522|nr:uncharacterized protein LOC128245752 [Mya arenaria]
MSQCWGYMSRLFGLHVTVIWLHVMVVGMHVTVVGLHGTVVGLHGKVIGLQVTVIGLQVTVVELHVTVIGLHVTVIGLHVTTMVTPLSNKFLGWGELENSIMYCLAGLEVIIVFGLVTWLSRRVQDRSLILCGTIVLTVANSWMIYVIPVAGECSYYTNLWRFIIGIIFDMLALPMLVSGSISLYSKITRVETQGLSMGLRRSVVGMATILGPLWAGSAITRPYIMFGVMLALLALSLFMLVLSFSKLVPSSEQPVNKAGLVTTTDSDEDITQPLIT